MRIRPSLVQDAEALADLHLDVWEEAYRDLLPVEALEGRRLNRDHRVDSWRKLLAEGPSTVTLAEVEDGNRLMGFVSSGPGRDDATIGLPDLEVMALYVRAEIYGTGIGYMLLRSAISSAAAYLWVLQGNERAVHFYERQGFSFDGAEKKAWTGTEQRMVRRGLPAIKSNEGDTEVRLAALRHARRSPACVCILA